MNLSLPARRTLALAVGVILAAVGLVAVSATDGTASASNRRPICNDLGFNAPTAVGGTVSIPVLDVAADPDLTPVTLTDVFGGAPVGSAAISGDSLVFTRTSTFRTTVYLYWTVSDGSLEAQCQAVAFDRPPSQG